MQPHRKLSCTRSRLISDSSLYLNHLIPEQLSSVSVSNTRLVTSLGEEWVMNIIVFWTCSGLCHHDNQPDTLGLLATQASEQELSADFALSINGHPSTTDSTSYGIPPFLSPVSPYPLRVIIRSVHPRFFTYTYREIERGSQW